MDTLHNPTMRVLQVLELVVASQDGITLSETAKKLEVPKSTLVPILKTLKECGYLELQEASGRYSGGYKLFTIGSAYLQRFDVMEEVGKELQRLAEQFRETCYFGILERGDVLYLLKKDTPRSLGVLASVGRTKPAYATGLGKALLMDYNEEELRGLYPQGLMPLTDATICDFGKLTEELSEQRKLGYAWEVEESTQHIRCFAVPLRKGGKTVGAISIAMPVFRYPEEQKEEIVKAFLTTQKRLEKTIWETDARFT